jgi:hypothetical protein
VKKLALSMAAFLLVMTFGTQAQAYFCGDPLADNCSVPQETQKSPENGQSPVNQENHPLATFALVPGESLKENFEAWGKASGWKVLWHSEYSFPVKAGYTAGRSFLGAVRRSIRIFNASSGGWLKVHAYLSNHVLLIEDGR